MRIIASSIRTDTVTNPDTGKSIRDDIIQHCTDTNKNIVKQYLDTRKSINPDILIASYEVCRSHRRCFRVNYLIQTQLPTEFANTTVIHSQMESSSEFSDSFSDQE